MIKTNIRTLLNAVSPLSEFAKEKLPVKASYRAMKLIREIDKELKIFEDQRQALLQKYEGKPEEETQDLGKEFTELLDLEVEIDLDPIPMVWLEDAEISTQTLIAIEFLLSE